MARRRNDRRYASGSVPLYDGDTTLGWRVTRAIPVERGERMVAQGVARAVVDEFGRMLGYQWAKPRETVAPESAPSPVSLTARAMQANAGAMGESRTATMGERRKTERVHPRSGRRLPPEDYVERARNKVREWKRVPLWNQSGAAWR